MRFWDLSDPAVEAADAEPWDMPLGSATRSFSVRSIIGLLFSAVFLYLAAGLAGVGYALSAGDHAAHGRGWLEIFVVTVLLAVVTVVYLLAVSPHQLRRSMAALAIALLVGTPALVAWGMTASGPGLALTALTSIQSPLYAYYILKLRWAVLHSVWLLACVALPFVLDDAWVAPWWGWLFIAANALGTGVVGGFAGARIDQLAAAEHAARVELADLNESLAEQVRTQVAEIERLSGLRRFLSTQVADVVLAGDSDLLERPHRARIAVFFCDLRGFTAFTNEAEPEEVVGVLDTYYGTVGGLLRSYDATVGDYAGDGIMAYFGDPVPREDAALAAVQMAADARDAMSDVATEWQRRGYDLSFGIGLGLGYATIGVIGFDGRYDYKPVGGVLNLASRLCARAGPGEVLLDHATHADTSAAMASDPVPALELKGYAGERRAYLLR